MGITVNALTRALSPIGAFSRSGAEHCLEYDHQARRAFNPIPLGRLIDLTVKVRSPSAVRPYAPLYSRKVGKILSSKSPLTESYVAGPLTGILNVMGLVNVVLDPSPSAYKVSDILR